MLFISESPPPAKAAIVDAMAEVQMLTNDCTTSLELAHKFSSTIFRKYANYDEVHVIFDTYEENSLKNATRRKRQLGLCPVYYTAFKTVNTSTKITNVLMKKLLSHVT